MSDLEAEAVTLLLRIYGREADRPLHDSDMAEDWIDEQIAAFIRKHGRDKLDALVKSRPKESL